MTRSYQELERIFGFVDSLEGAKAILHWDMNTVMPKGSIESRTNQLVALTSQIHKLVTDKKIADLIGEAKNENLDDWQKANLREMETTYIHEAGCDAKLIEEFSAISTESEHYWAKARTENDWKGFSAILTKLVKYVREIANIKSSELKLSLYDALLDQYDRGRRSEEIDQIFGQLKKFLPEFTAKVIDYQATNFKTNTIEGTFPIEKQKAFGMECMKLVKFDFNRGRLDESVHPFCGGVPSDVRITTRYQEHDFLTALMGVMHESGHALYENNLPSKWLSQPVGKARGMSIHESQSLFIEMQCMRSREFSEYIWPKMSTHFGLKNDNINLFQLQNKVTRSLIRVDADEVTYPLHVILRYEIEKALIEGKIEVSDMPDMFNDLMEKYIGIRPKDYKDGCMQDVHWGSGIFGYFPCYSLGAIFAAECFATMEKLKPDVRADLKTGDFSYIISWLNENVHRYGSYYETKDLHQKVTGHRLSADSFINYLNKKYL